MSIIKGKTNIVAGFGGTKRNIGEVYFSQSSLATDNSGALPGWTGEYYENGKTLFPDLYNFVKAHSELQVTKTEYDNAISTYGECPKYVVDENGGTNVQSVTRYVWTDTASSTGGLITKTRNPQVGDPVWYWNEQSIKKVTDFDTVLSDNVITNISSDSITATVDTTNGASIPELTDITATFTEEQANKGTITVTTAGTSLRLPKYANYIKMAGAEGITQKGAGLPNIDSDTNWVNATDGTETAATNTNNLSDKGVFGGTNSQGGHGIYGNNYPINWRRFDASKSNAIYGASDTVTPAHTTLYPWVCAYNAAVPASTVQAAEFTGALAGKANTDLSNLSADGKDIASGLGMPSNRYIDLTLGASGTKYTAPANGWFAVRVPFTGNQACSLSNANSLLGSQCAANGGWTGYTSIPTNKGDVITLLYNCTPNLFRFVYAEGAE